MRAAGTTVQSIGARTTAIEITVAEAIGESFDRDAFRAAYGTINVAKYHPFTADNQDYLAYICLMISAGFITTETLLAEVDAGRVASFRDFIEQVEAGCDRLPSDALRGLHADIYGLVVAGDPTPFKAFRRREYRETVSRMGHLPDDAPLAQRLVEEVCLTARGGGVRPLAGGPRLPAAGGVGQTGRGDHALPGAGSGGIPAAASYSDTHRRAVNR